MAAAFAFRVHGVAILSSSVREADLAPPELALSHTLLVAHAPLARRRGRAGWTPRAGSDERAPDEDLDLLASVLQVAVLVACPLAHDHETSVRIEPAFRKVSEAVARRGIEAFDAIEGHTELDLRRDLVDVLPARARGARGVELESGAGNDDGQGDTDRIHSPSLAAPTAARQGRTPAAADPR